MSTNEMQKLADELEREARYTPEGFRSHDMLMEAAAALRAAAQNPEPVAYRMRTPDGHVTSWFDGKPPNRADHYEVAYATPPAPSEPQAAPAPHAEGQPTIASLLDDTECTDADDLRDMANVGKALMERIAEVSKLDGSFKGWSPAQCPTEIVFDLINALDEARSQPQAAPTREEIADAVRGAMVENWKDSESGRSWNEDILLTGCRKAGGMGYQKPEDAAQNLAFDAADAILALTKPAQREG